MERTKLLTISVIGLLLLNIATLSFMFLNGPKDHRLPHEGRPKPREIIIKKLHFDATQQKEYDKLIQWHRDEIDAIDAEIRHGKYMLYSLLRADTTQVKFNATKQRLIRMIAVYQEQIEETHFKHFQDIRKLCNPQQQKDFDNLIVELPRIFAPKPHGPRRNE